MRDFLYGFRQALLAACFVLPGFGVPVIFIYLKTRGEL